MEISNAVREAAAYVLAREAVDGNEHGVLLDADGKCIFTVDGDENHIEVIMTPDLQKRAKIMVHNHPGNSSLSLEDIMNATMTGIEVYAVGMDGSFYASRGFNRQENEDIRTYRQCDDKVVTLAAMAYSFGAATGSIKDLLGHLTNEVMSKKGYYDYRFLLSEQAKAYYAQNRDVITRIKDSV
jgi:hypothetical protein